jgi:hypothetical protein
VQTWRTSVEGAISSLSVRVRAMESDMGLMTRSAVISFPMQAVLASWFLYSILGWSVLVGLAGW